MKKEAKIMVKENVYYPTYWNERTPISQMKEDLNKLEEVGATHISFTIDNSYGDLHSLEIEAFKEVEESDEAYNKRIEKKRVRLAEQEKRELAELERLQNKYKKESSK